jgi:hypothetical protein
VIIPSQRRSLAAAAALVAAICGITAAILFARAGLTLSHPEARTHLVIARSIVDSLTPGSPQIGFKWLPLPHLLNALPVQLDGFFRSGMSAVVISIMSFALAAGALAWIVELLTDSLWASSAAVFVFVINPNLLYLQSTPMTEALMLGLILLAVAMTAEWCSDGEGSWSTRPSSIGIVYMLACLTRYEAWPVTVTALAAAVWARRGSELKLSGAIRSVMPIAAYPAVAILGFLILRRLVDGEWFTSGSLVEENPALGDPGAAASQVLTGVRSLGGTVTTVVALVGLIGLLARGLVADASAVALLALAPAAAASLPLVAFLVGHPYRVRYVIPLLAAQAIGIGAAASRWQRATPAAALVLMTIAAVELVPMFGAAPMTAEAQWDGPNAAARRQVTACLAGRYDGTTIVASMRSLGHYMQELSHEGLRLRDFLHEGNSDMWVAAIKQARPFAGWVLIDESAGSGDVLAEITREDPRWLDGFSRVCDGGGVALYRRLQVG